MKTLVIGCSFCNNLIWDYYTQQIDWKLHPDIHVSAFPGSGNESMTARLLDRCSQHHYDHVLILWSGINRIDVPISLELHQALGGSAMVQSGPFFETIGQTVWYHSGGIAGRWSNDSSYPGIVKQIIKNQYLEANKGYLSDRTLRSIITAQSFLLQQNISFKMAFAYDIHKEYSHREGIFGKIDTISSLNKLVSWDHVQTQNTLYDWAQEQANRLEKDRLHPTRNAMREWILDNFEIDIAE
jgi:hypothetical protein